MDAASAVVLLAGGQKSWWPLPRGGLDWGALSTWPLRAGIGRDRNAEEEPMLCHRGGPKGHPQKRGQAV